MRSWLSTRDRRTAAPSGRLNAERVRVISAPRDEHPGSAQPEARGGAQRVRAAAQQRRVRRPSDACEAGRGTGTATRTWARAAPVSASRMAPPRSPATATRPCFGISSQPSRAVGLLPGSWSSRLQSQTGSSRSRGCRSAARSFAAPPGARSAAGTSGSRSSTRTRTSAGVSPRPAGAWRSDGTPERSTLAAARRAPGDRANRRTGSCATTRTGSSTSRSGIRAPGGSSRVVWIGRAWMHVLLWHARERFACALQSDRDGARRARGWARVFRRAARP